MPDAAAGREGAEQTDPTQAGRQPTGGLRDDWYDHRESNYVAVVAARNTPSGSGGVDDGCGTAHDDDQPTSEETQAVYFQARQSLPCPRAEGPASGGRQSAFSRILARLARKRTPGITKRSGEQGEAKTRRSTPQKSQARRS
mmetsp:Transcript_21148/g.51636  ORF Transcript_21148/g.51636 Transcript_21148/m.51636 type:complete len:142 (-) Transcript_21148:98-523(-)